MENISDHISYKEATFSQTATRKGLDNDPNKDQLINMKMLANKVFEPLRAWVGGAVKINSFFRSEALNTAIGGSKTSQHCGNSGAAVDLDDTYGHKSNKAMFNYIKDNLVFDQMIWEFGDKENPNWVHVSYREGNNRMQILRAIRKNGRVSYVPYE